MDEKKWLDQIRQAADDVEIPESLSPENIKKKLEHMEQKAPEAGAQGTKNMQEAQSTQEEQKRQEARSSEEKTEGPAAKMRTRRRKWAVRIAEAAAALAIVVAAGNQVRLLRDGAAGTAPLSREVVEDNRMTPQGEAPENANEQEEAAMPEAAPVPESYAGITPAGDAKNLFQNLWDYLNARKLRRMMAGSGDVNYDAGVVYDAAAEEEAEMMMLDESGSEDFSTTNLREAGVDEGDLVKTDGEYLYILKKSGKVMIVRAGEELALVSEVLPETLDEYMEAMYLDGDRLIVVSSGTKSSLNGAEEVYEVETQNYCRILTYDVSDRSRPAAAGSVEQEGYYRSSRKVGNYVYLFTQYQPTVEPELADSQIQPKIAGTDMDAAKIYLPENLLGADVMDYLVMGAVDITHPSAVSDSAAVVAGAELFYVSAQNIYICSGEYRGSRDQTQILKFCYDEGQITGAGAGTVPGYFNDSFSLDEYNGYLRAVTTEYRDGEETNGLYILDEQMALVGKIEDIAKGETVRSARFFGDTGYFVTFRQTDPLFSVDLSDPKQPVVLGELKVTGFSSYLHFYGKDRLLGIGFEADPETGVTNGIKLSMFDISDPANVTEIRKLVLKGASYCPGVYDYKAIMIDPQKNLFGFVADGDYLVFSYGEEEGFVNRLTYALDRPQEESFWYRYGDLRSLYIGESFYLADDGQVLQFDMKNDFSLSQKLVF